MNANPAAALVEAWEQGQTQHPLHRALTILRAADPRQSWDDLAALPIPERDRRLIALREQWVGARFEAVATCPECREPLEFSFSHRDLPLEGVSPGSDWSWAGEPYRTRMPATIDLVAAAEVPLDERIAALATRCADPVPPPEAYTALADHLAALDPLLDFEIDLTCPSCGHSWLTPFDVAQYFWPEIAERAQRLLREVHLLAQAYSWTERDILALSPRRRRIYLDLVLGA